MYHKHSCLISFILSILFVVTAASLPLCAQTFNSGVSKEHADGVVATIVARVAEKLDIGLRMRHAPFARRLVMMKTGDIDIMGGLLKREERTDFIHFVDPPYVESGRRIFFVRKGEAQRIRSYEDLYGLEIGTKINAKYFSRFDRDENLIKQPVSSVSQSFKKLMRNRIDAVVYNYRSGYTELLEMGLAEQVEPAAYYFEGDNPVYIGISRQSPLMERKADVERVVREMVASGEMSTLIKRFYSYLPGKM
ncbi:MAG TPA: hypothetical protein DHV36_00725 [Desulfobacteraceae bacterium]|nr:hypothetical protein [Desulfobacteraceae bacterium]